MISTGTHTYDADRRLTRIDYVTDAVPSAQVFTQWDQFGRPTAWTSSGSSATASYDDAARTLTVTTAGVPGSVTHRYDANGILIGYTNVGPNRSVTGTVTVRSTATVCR